MSDITISVIQPPSTTINVGVDETTLIQAGMGLPPHSVTHISGGSDEINHNLLAELQGGSGGQYYHLSSGQYFNLVTGTGSFYPNNNPSGFITGVDLSPYATITYVTGISGQLQAQITVLNNQTGSYVLNSQTGQFYSSSNPSGFITGVDLSFSGNYYTKTESESRYVNVTGAETILGDKTFHDKVYINNLYVTGLETIVNTTNTNVASNYIMLNLTGGAVDGGIFFVTGSGLTGINDSGAIIGFDHSDKFKFGIGTRASDLSTLSTIASFSDVTGASGNLQTQINTLNSATGSYILDTETGQFYPNSNPSGFITGINNIVYTTGNQIISGAKTFTGSFNVSTNDAIIIRSTGYTNGVEIGGGYFNKIADGGFTNDFGVGGAENHFGDSATSSNSFGGSAVQNDFGAYATLNNYYAGFGIGQFDFDTRPTVSGTGVLLEGEIPDTGYLSGYVNKNETGDFYPRTNPSGYITGINNLVFTTGNQTISGAKTFSNNLVVGGNDLFVDTSTDRVGISTATPTATLDVNGSGIFRSGLNVTGNLNLTGTLNINAIGELYTPALTTNGPILVNGSYFDGLVWQARQDLNYVALSDYASINYISVGDYGIILEASTQSFQINAPTIINDSLTGNSGIFLDSLTAPNLVYNTGNQTIGGAKTFSNNLTVNGGDLFVNTSNNRVGINTTTPTTTLDVNGSGLFRSGLNVNLITSTGSDFYLSGKNNATEIFAGSFIGGFVNLKGGSGTLVGGYVDLKGGDNGGYIRIQGGNGINQNANLPVGPVLINSFSTEFNKLNTYSSDVIFWKTGLSTIVENARISQDSISINNNLLITGNRPTINGTGILLSGEATTQSYVTGISGGLQTQITTLNNQTGSYYPRTNPSGYITGVDLSFSGNYYTKDESESRYVNTTGAETILGNKTFHDNVYINNLYVTGLETIVNTTNTNVASNYIMLNLTGGAVDGGIFFVTGSGLTGINDSGAIIGFDHSDQFKFGISTRASDLSTLNTIASVEQMTGISGGLQTQISTLNNQTGSYVLNNQTGNFITTSQTGDFYANSNPSGFITGINDLVYTTGDQSISGNINISGNLTISGVYNIYQQIENAKILSIAYAIAL